MLKKEGGGGTIRGEEGWGAYNWSIAFWGSKVVPAFVVEVGVIMYPVVVKIVGTWQEVPGVVGSSNLRSMGRQPSDASAVVALMRNGHVRLLAVVGGGRSVSVMCSLILTLGNTVQYVGAAGGIDGACVCGVSAPHVTQVVLLVCGHPFDR